MESKPKKRTYKPANTKGQVVFYSEQEKKALAHIGSGSVAEGIRISVRWAAHFWRVGLRPDHDLNHVGICLFVDDDLADDL
jgi:hypothetical protein